MGNRGGGWVVWRPPARPRPPTAARAAATLPYNRRTGRIWAGLSALSIPRRLPEASPRWQVRREGRENCHPSAEESSPAGSLHRRHAHRSATPRTGGSAATDGDSSYSGPPPRSFSRPVLDEEGGHCRLAGGWGGGRLSSHKPPAVRGRTRRSPSPNALGGGPALRLGGKPAGASTRVRRAGVSPRPPGQATGLEGQLGHAMAWGDAGGRAVAVEGQQRQGGASGYAEGRQWRRGGRRSTLNASPCERRCVPARRQLPALSRSPGRVRALPQDLLRCWPLPYPERAAPARQSSRVLSLPPPLLSPPSPPPLFSPPPPPPRPPPPPLPQPQPLLSTPLRRCSDTPAHTPPSVLTTTTTDLGPQGVASRRGRRHGGRPRRRHCCCHCCCCRCLRRRRRR